MPFFIINGGFVNSNKIIFLLAPLIASLVLVVGLNLNASTPAPKIENIYWGTVLVRDGNGSLQAYKDCKVTPTESKEWNWGQTGTQHNPGIQIEDLQEFVNSVDVVILSRGMNEVLQTKPETIKYLEKNGKEYHQLQSEKAAQKYNELVAQGRKVGGLFHSTC